MNKLKLVMLWCLIAGAMMSCGKEDETEPGVNSELDYQPTTAGSTWTYGGVSPYTSTALGTNKVMNGKTYHEMETAQGTQKNKSYLLKENGVYTAIGMDPSMQGVELVFLKEHAAVGETWEHMTVLNGIDTRMRYTIVEKDGSKTVEGKTFKQVIRVKMESTYYYMGSELMTLETNYYWAKGIGLILSDFGQQGQVPLLNYSIK